MTRHTNFNLGSRIDAKSLRITPEEALKPRVKVKQKPTVVPKEPPTREQIRATIEELQARVARMRAEGRL